MGKYRLGWEKHTLMEVVHVYRNGETYENGYVAAHYRGNFWDFHPHQEDPGRLRDTTP